MSKLVIGVGIRQLSGHFSSQVDLPCLGCSFLEFCRFRGFCFKFCLFRL